jgi:hypothetical protein
MKAFEFQTRIGPEGTVPIPSDLRDEVGPDQPVRVLLLVAESTDDADWARLTARQFLQGYDVQDAIYDNLPGR